MDQRKPKDAGPQGSRPPRGGRRRRRGSRPDGSRPGGRGEKPADSPPALEDAPAAAAIDATRRLDEPLSPAELVEMRGHLKFLFKNREGLRLKVNAAEDLLLNGAREPRDRGTVLHLLSKVDLPAVTSALSRVTDPQARAVLLAGVVRFSTDAGILLLYLETLQDIASRDRAATAFAHAVRRIDFAALSPARMRRLLDVVAHVFDGPERVQVLFGLLQSASFRAAFESSAPGLPAELADLFVPLQAAHEVVVEGLPNRFDARALHAGVQALLEAPDAHLREHPEDIRERLLEAAMRWPHERALADRATDVLLDTLTKTSRSFSRLAMLRAQELLRRHDDAAARALLEQVRANHPGFQMPSKWILAIDAPRVGRLALWGRDERAGDRFRSAFWLDAQRSAWVRIGSADEAEALTRAALLQRQVAMSGVAPVLECGVAPEGTPYVIVPVAGRPLDGVMARGRLTEAHVIRLALAGAQVLLGLALAGVELADASPARFLAIEGEPPQLLMADFAGARRSSSETALPAHRLAARSLCDALWGARTQPDPAAPTLDDGTGSLADLIRTLALRSMGA